MPTALAAIQLHNLYEETAVTFNVEREAPGQFLFYSSSQSQTGKAQKWLWVSALIGLVASLAIQKNSPGFPTFTIVTFMILFGGIWLFLRSLLKPGQVLVTVNQDFIDSPLFRSPIKRFPWSEVAGVSFNTQSNARILEFKLLDKDGRPDKRNFWNGVNYARPSIQLAVFDERTQEKMLDAIKLCMEKQKPADGQAIGELVNEIAIEREFQERLRAMAPVPWVTYSLIAMNGLIWLLTLSMGAGFVIAGADKLLVWGGNAASEVQRGEWWRLVSATFLHSGFMHVTMNMVGLAAAGVTVERIYGHRLFTLIYFGSGLSGSALSLHFGAQNAVSVGASGAVFGVTGALLVAVFQHRDKLPKTFSKQTISGLSIFILYALIQGFAKQGIDNAAHVGGLLGGCLCAFILPERFDMARFKSSYAKSAVMAFVIVGTAAVGLAAMAPRATIDQARIFASNEILIQSVKRFDEGMKAVQQDQSDLKSGKLSEREADDRSRVVHAPVFRQIADGLSKVVLRPGDPRVQVTKDIQRMSELLYETLAMESVFNGETGKFEPIDPKRAAIIDEELIKIAERTTKSLNSNKGNGTPENAPRVAVSSPSSESRPNANDGWSLDLETFQGGMTVQEVSNRAKEKGYTLKCYGDLGKKERVRKDDKSACWVAIATAWGIPASMTAFTFGDNGLQTQLIRFPETSWPKVNQRLDQMGQRLPQSFGTDDETGGPVFGWRMNSGLVFSAAPAKGKELTVFWNAKTVVAVDYCPEQNRAPNGIRHSYSVPIKELWPEITCDVARN